MSGSKSVRDWSTFQYSRETWIPRVIWTEDLHPWFDDATFLLKDSHTIQKMRSSSQTRKAMK
jgi:hypothetical protein